MFNRRMDPEAASTEKIVMRHGSWDPDCPLCPISGPPVADPLDLESGHSDAYRIWSEWNPAEPARTWVPRVERVLTELGVVATPEQITDHFAKHRIEQPAMPGNIDNELFRRQALALKQRQRDLINALYCQRVLTAGQIREVFYRPGRRPESAKKSAQLDLRPLVQGHFLYRLFPGPEEQALRNAPKKFATTPLYFLGKRAIPFIQGAHGLSFQPGVINGAATLSRETLIHDIRANEVFVSLARQINKRSGNIFTSWGEALVGYDPVNWYGPGPRSLAMGFGDPLSTEYLRIKPDGMATISLLARSDEYPETLLPFFIEYDHGTKDIKDVAEQLFVYHLLARSGAVGQRFPQLDVEGYSVPVVMVFSDPEQRQRVHQRFRALAEEAGVNNGAPILLADEEAWDIKPFAPGVCWNAWAEDDRGAFLEILLRTARPLWEKRPLPPGSFLELNPDGAPARAAGAGSKAGKAEGRELRQEQVEAEEKAARQAAVDRAIAERRARQQNDDRGEEDGKVASAPDPEEKGAPSATPAAGPVPTPVPEPPADVVPDPVVEAEIQPQPPGETPAEILMTARVEPTPDVQLTMEGEVQDEDARPPLPTPSDEAEIAETPSLEPAPLTPEGPSRPEEQITPANPVQEVERPDQPPERPVSTRPPVEQPAPAQTPVDPLDPFAAGPKEPEDEVAALKRELAEIKQALAGAGDPVASAPMTPPGDLIPGLQPSPTPPAPVQQTAAEPPPVQEEPELPDPAELLAQIRSGDGAEPEPEQKEPEPYIPAYAETAATKKAPAADAFPDLEQAPTPTPTPAVPPTTPPQVRQPQASQAPPVDPPPAVQTPERQHPAAPLDARPPAVMDRPIGGAPLPPIPEPPGVEPAIDDQSAAARRRARRRRSE